MPSAEIIAIGSELLLGETQDTNTHYLLNSLRNEGIDIFRTSIIGDNKNRISQAIRFSISHADIVIATGGLGPTVDDPAREAFALAFDCDLQFHPELWDEISAYFGKMKRDIPANNKRQAYLPACAVAISNPVGTAPAFYILKDGKLCVSLPGVPREMKCIWEKSVIPLIRANFQTDNVILMKTLHSYGMGESAVDELVGDLEESANPTLGLSAKHGQIDLRITAKANDRNVAEKLVDQFEAEIRRRLKDYIFGINEETLPSVVNSLLKQNNITLCIDEVNTGGSLFSILEGEHIIAHRSEESDQDVSFESRLSDYCSDNNAQFGVGLFAKEELNGTYLVKCAILTPDGVSHFSPRIYNRFAYEDRQPGFFALNNLRLTIIPYLKGT